jgi:uncharacterized membrane protein
MHAGLEGPWLLIVVALIMVTLTIVLLARYYQRRPVVMPEVDPPRKSDNEAIRVLQLRLATGEISVEEYHATLTALRS